MADNRLTFPESSSPFVSRLIVVADKTRLIQTIRQRYPGVQISAVPTFLSGIAELANGPVHAILAYVDPEFPSLERAVRGLRQAAGNDVPLVLVCEPHCEPAVRKALQAGASDYLINPPTSQELDALLSLRASTQYPAPQPPAPNEVEMSALARVLESMSDTPHRVLSLLAELLMAALPARAVQIVVDGATGKSGENFVEPVVRETIRREDQAIGEVMLGPCKTGGYSGADIDKLRYYVNLFAHIVQVAKSHHAWQQMAMTDELSQLPNRRYAMQFLEKILVRAAQERFRVTVCLFDIDDFKPYNDEFGHDTGDEIIRAVGQLFLRHCRVEDVVARYGGDEFVVVFWDSESPRVAGSEHPNQAIDVMQRFQKALQEFEFGCLGTRAKGTLTISGGLASYPWDATTASDLIKRADEALLEAKRLGKNRIHIVGGVQAAPVPTRVHPD